MSDSNVDFESIAYNKQFGDKRYLPLIPNSAYGPNDNFNPESGHVLSSLMAKIHEAKVSNAETVVLWGTGSPRREFVHADDIASACLLLLQVDVSKLEFPINIGVGSDVSIKEMAEKISDIVGYSGNLRWDSSKPDGAHQKLLDSTRVRSIGWKPAVSFSDGLRQTYEWYVKSLEGHEEKVV